MFSQSHIRIAWYLADEMQVEEVKRHRMSLSLGSVLPDRNPRMRMKDHEFDATWEDVKKRICAIEEEKVTDKKSERRVCRQIGIVLHYLADYFTCPHNPSYGINIVEHGIYEGLQVLSMRAYLVSPKAEERFLTQKETAARIHGTEDLFSYIERKHDRYLQKSEHTPKEDCRWVLNVCACTAVVLSTMVFGETER